MKILLIHGPNLNKLGFRDPHFYGAQTLAQITKSLTTKVKKRGHSLESFQSNHEGELIDFLQKEAQKADGILINPGALSHSSYALKDALLDTKLPCIEVHLSKLFEREDYRRKSVTAEVCALMIYGKGVKGYREALDLLLDLIEKKRVILQNQVIGNPLDHSLSPELHGLIYNEIGLAAVMKKRVVPPDELKKIISDFRENKGALMAVTLPHKESVMEYLDEIDPLAKKIGSVNTVLNKNGRLVGSNTDIVGIKAALEGVKIKNKKILILGAGGASKALCYFLKSKGADVLVYNRTHQKALDFAKKYKVKAVSLADLNPQDIDVIVNATPLGMHPFIHECPLSADFLLPKHTVFDLIYNPEKTLLLHQAESIGAKTRSGLLMFVAQGVAQVEKLSGRKIPKLSYEKYLRTYL